MALNAKRFEWGVLTGSAVVGLGAGVVSGNVWWGVLTGWCLLLGLAERHVSSWRSKGQGESAERLAALEARLATVENRTRPVGGR